MFRLGTRFNFKLVSVLVLVGLKIGFKTYFDMQDIDLSSKGYGQFDVIILLAIDT
jgi:hypothetical protein